MMSKKLCSICGSSGHLIHSNLTDRLAGAPGAWDMIECDNRECGLIWLGTVPSPDTLALAYSHYYTHVMHGRPGFLRRLYNRCRTGYLVSRFGYPKALATSLQKVAGWMIAILPHRRAALDASILWLPWKSNGKVLEIGCGNGDRLSLLKDLGWHTLGVEPDPKSAQIARERGLDVISQPFGNGLINERSVDAILLCHVIEHLSEPSEALKECHRILKPGGILIMLTPNTKSLGYRQFGRNWLHLDPPRHLTLFNANNMCRMLESAGFATPKCSASLRDANWTLAGSLALRNIGGYKIGSLPFPLRFLGMCLMYIEWFWALFNPSCGEEIVSIAKK